MSKITQKLNFIDGEPNTTSNNIALFTVTGEIQKKSITASRKVGTYWSIREGSLSLKLHLAKHQSVKLRIKMPQRIGENLFEIIINGKEFGSPQRFTGYQDFSEGVYDISEFVKSGENEIVITSVKMALDEIAFDIEEVASPERTIKNPTRLVLDVYHKINNDDKSELFIAQLYPNEKLAVVNSGTYLFKTVNTKKIVDRLDCSSEALNSYLVKYKKPDTSVANQLSVKNDSNMEVSLEKINFQGDFKFVSKLLPGERFTGTAFLDEPHILRDAHSGAVVDFFYSRYREENRNSFNARDLDNLTRAVATTVRFINCEDKAIGLLNKVENGWREIVKIGIGQIYEQPTHSGQVWEFTKPMGGYLVETSYFIPNADEFQSVFIIDKKKGIEVSFKNQTNFSLKAYKKIGEQRYFFGYIAPQSTFTRYSYKNSKWEFTTVAGDAETNTIDYQQVSEAGTYPITGNLLNTLSQQDVGVRKVHLTNHASVELKVQKQLDGLSSEVIANIAPLEELSIECAAGIVLDFRDIEDSSKVGQLIVPSGEDTFNYPIEIKSLNDRNPSKLTINNHTNLVLDLIWLDYEGKEVAFPEFIGNGTRSMNTFLTHPWLIKERRSGRILKRLYGLEQDQTVNINTSDLIKTDQNADVEISFSNTLPFTVDLYEVVTNREEVLIGTLQEGGTISVTNKNAGLVRIREHASQEMIDTFIPIEAPKQTFEVQAKPIKVSKDAEVEIFNLSFFDVDIYTFDDNGKRIKVSTVDTRMSEKITRAKVGQSFFLKEKKSGKVVGYFLATEKRLRYEFTGIDLRSASNSGEVTTVNIKNNSKYSGTLYLVDYDGSKVNKGILGATSEVQVIDARPGNVYVFIENNSDILLDQVIVGDYVAGTIDLLPDPISKTKRTADHLWPGEVALFTADNYQGDAFIFHSDLYSFLDTINDKVRSIKLGPGTALTAFEHTNFKGVNDVFHLDMANLTETDIKLTLSSFQISYVALESTSGISAISRLSEEPIVESDTNINNIKHRSVYRTTISFPPTVSAVDIYTTEESTFEVRGNIYTTDPVKSAQIKLGENKQLVVTTEANALEQAIFMVRANTMKTNERFFVFQDVDVYKKILKLKQGSLAKNRNKLGVESGISNNELDGIQSALQNLASTIPAVHGSKAHGNKQDLYAMADTMEYDSWGLNFEGSGTQTIFRPLSPEELAVATRQGDDTVLRRNLDAEAGQWGISFPNPVSFVVSKVSSAASTVSGGISSAAKTVAGVTTSAVGAVAGGVLASAGTVKGAVSSTTSTVSSGVSAIVSGVADTAQTVASTGVSTAIGAITLADVAVDKGLSLATGAATVVVSGASTLGGLVVEGASKSIDVVSAIPSVAKEVAITVADGVASVSKKVLQVTINLGESIVEFTLDTVDKIKSCIKMIIDKVFSAVKGVIDFFKDLFAWGDILDTKDMITAFFNETLYKIMNDALPALESKVDGIFKYLEDSVMGKLDDLINNFSSDFKDHDEEPGFFDEAKDKISWFLDKVFGSDNDKNTSGNAQSSGSIALDNNTNNSSGDPTILSLLEELKVKLIGIINENGKTAMNAFLDGIGNITKAITGNGNPLKRMVVGVLSLVKALSAFGFGILKAVSAILFKLIKLVFVFLKDILNESLNTPFISKLYKSFTGNDLSALELIALVCAAPTTILTKLIYGKSPRELQSPAALTNEDSEKDAPKGLEIATPIVTIIYASLATIYAVIDSVQSIIDYGKPPVSGASSVSVLDKVKYGVSIVLLLLPITNEILNQISRNYRDEGSGASTLGWVLLALTVIAVGINGLALLIPQNDIVDGIIKGGIAVISIVTIPVYIIYQVISIKGKSRDNDVLKIAAGIAIFANLLEAGKIKLLKVGTPAASVVFYGAVGVQAAINFGAGVVAIVGQGISMSGE